MQDEVSHFALTTESERLRNAIFFDLDVVSHGDNTRWAVFSKCQRFRYALGRFWEDRPDPELLRGRPAPRAGVLVVCALNPSTADHRPPPQGDDNTVRKLMFWARRDGYLGLIVVNAFALRSTDPAALIESHPDSAVGEHNDTVIFRAIHDHAAVAVAAWGKPKWKQLESRLLYVQNTPWERRWRVFGMTKDGVWPRHPLYLKNSTKISDWPVRAA